MAVKGKEAFINEQEALNDNQGTIGAQKGKFVRKGI